MSPLGSLIGSVVLQWPKQIRSANAKSSERTRGTRTNLVLVSLLLVLVNSVRVVLSGRVDGVEDQRGGSSVLELVWKRRERQDATK